MKKYVKEELKINKKGFTLVELLAVIVILAVIMVITIPTVLGSMNKAKQSAFNTIGETMIKYLESNYQNCKIGNKEIAKFDEDLFDINNNCELQSGNLSEKLIVNSGYSTDDIEKVNVEMTPNGEFNLILTPNAKGKFASYRNKSEEVNNTLCWSTELIGNNEYKFVEFLGIDQSTGDIVSGCESYVTKNGDSYSITIPSNYLNKNITTIGNNLFQAIYDQYENSIDMSKENFFKKIKNIVIEEGITTIEDGVDYYLDDNNYYYYGSFVGIESSNLTLQFPTTLTYIGKNAFLNSSLENLVLPSNLKIIGDSAFYGCDIKSLVIPSSVENIGEYAFSYNLNLTTIDFIGAEDYISNLKTVGDYAFSDCNLDYQNESYYLQIPNEITSMGSGVFASNYKLRYIRFTGDRNRLGNNWYGDIILLPRLDPS